MSLSVELKKQGDFLFKNRSYLPIIILVVGLYLYVDRIMNITLDEESRRGIFEIACFGVCLLGLLIRVITIGYTADQTSGRNTSVGQVAETVNTTGIYSALRHPLYLGNFFMWLGIAAFTFNFWFVVAFVFMYWVYYERIMYAEEQFLIGKFGASYTDYSMKTPAFIPRLTGWTPPAYSFSFIKVIRQEKAGILNLFLVILLMRVAGEYLAKGAVSVESYWIYGFALSLAWYIVIKIIQKTTRLLEHDR
jgi:protein-S-isoprenylcysteine O-methyltransferase Ste14